MILVNPDAHLYRSIPPLALAYMATFLRARVVDQNTRPEPPDRFLKKETNLLGIFVRSVTYSESRRIEKAYKEKYPQAKVKSILTPIDVQCCYPTVQFKEKMVFDKPFGDNYPFPDFSLFDSFDAFLSHWQDGSWPYGILTSLGCPFQCVYCAARNRGWKPRSAVNCVDELKQAKNKYRIASFEILDDAFNINKARVMEFCKLVKPLKLPWICANGLRADLLDEEEAKAMADSGCTSVSFGVESTDPGVLKNIRKGETIEQISKAVDIARKYFKVVNGFFILGLPGSSFKKDLKSVEWIVKKGITGVFSYHVPFNAEMNNEEMFYGEAARPLSDEYPRKQQEQIYKMTEFMKGPTTGKNFVPRALATTRLAWKFDKKKLPLHLANNLKKVLG